MPDFNDLISQAKKMQEKMKETQEALKKIEVEGISGGGTVKVTLNGDSEINVIDIVYMVNIILAAGTNDYTPTDIEMQFGDIAPYPELDGIINVVDIVALVNIILSN